MNIWWKNCSTICLSVLLRDQRRCKRLKVNAALFCSFFFPNLVLRPKNWHPIRARTLTCVRWELFNYFGELQHDMKSVFWVTELRLDYASMWWGAAVSSALFQLSFHTRSCDLFFWLKCCRRLVLFLGGELPSCRKKVLAMQRSNVLLSDPWQCL